MTFRPNKLHSRNLRLGIATVAALGLLVAIPASAQATAQPSVGLGTAKTFAVLAGTKVENTGPSKISGSVGLSPAFMSGITGFPPGLVTNGTTLAGAAAHQPKLDLTAAYVNAAGRTPAVVVSKDLGGQTLTQGVYKAPGELKLTGTLTLNGQNDPNAVFIFQAGSDLITASTSKVRLIKGVSPCNVFWQVTSSATLGSDSSFTGTILASTSISLDSRATVEGRVLAQTGAVTLHANTITNSSCKATPVSSPATATSQIKNVPSGAVRTGDGSTSGGGNNTQGLLAGALLLAGVGSSTVVVARRRRR